MADTAFTVSIAGNPNCGKTSVFNALTGARQHVGNWPGVTVERTMGSYRDGGLVEVVDLPGVYTFATIAGIDSLDERVAQEAIITGKTQVIVNVVDATNLERNLYLTAQLLEMRVPMVVAINMADLAQKQGISIDPAHLADHLGCPVVPVVASRGDGIESLRAAIREVAEAGKPPKSNLDYPGPIEHAVEKISGQIAGKAFVRGVDPRWLAVKLLEGDPAAEAVAEGLADPTLAQAIPEIEAALGDDIDILITGTRYGFANGLAHHVVRRVHAVKRSVSDRLDKLVLNRWLGLPIFLGLMYLMFMFTINLGGVFIDFFDIAAQTVFVDGMGALLASLGTPEWLKVLVADGLGGGIQVVATFIPIIGFLYIFLSILEDSGYMSRAAFLMDRYMRRIGLPGKAFVPLIVGFGCNVPSIMATRTLEQQRDRTMAVMMAPFMSCGARLAVYALFAAAFFPTGGQNIVFALYLIGILAAIGTGYLLKSTLLKGETTPFVMELPRYHMPTAKGVAIHTWSRLKSFIVEAGQIIVIVVIVLSFMNSAGTDGSFGNEDSDTSVLAAVGRATVPVFEPLGIREENWPATVGIFTGIFAKEAVVGTLDALYSSLDRADAPDAVDEGGFSLIGGLRTALATIPNNLAGFGDLVLDPLGFDAAGVGDAAATEQAQEVTDSTFGAMVARFDGKIGAFAYLLLILLYVPCVAALGAIRREIGTNWMIFATVWTLGLGYGAAVVFYQAATFARHPGSSAAWIGGITLVLVAVYAGMRRIGLRDGQAAQGVASE